MDVLETNKNVYKRWAANKLEAFTANINDLLVEISNPKHPSNAEIGKIKGIMESYNIVFYEFSKPNSENTKNSLIRLLNSLEITDFAQDSKSDANGVTPIGVNPDSNSEEEYIPYTDKSLNWHTDGYYNQADETIYSWLLHCSRSALNGGVNSFIDHEIAYILFNELTNKINSLMSQDAYIIPENKKNGRKEIKSYVFSYNNPYKKLHMKFTMREKNIIWNQNDNEAIQILKSIIENNNDYTIKYKLKPNQGVITNNVIHSRTAFTNDINHHRLIYRIRSKQRINL
mgnify:CR=1 FL=1|tara:strand:- start:453 stop:1310 length:858 start_codon:yes stop_codon:yes gene_type:complete